ncbi:MAG: iron-containing alcohol dehydrogenase [Magnetococcales bacterium]|nr:iron-containing alcohol dehydrogenase [Magnetococcales bacterium]
MLPFAGFTIAALPKIIFGSGSLPRAVTEAAAFGRHILLVTGARSLDKSPSWPLLHAALERHGLSHDRVRIDCEPSPEWVDATVARFHGHGIACVLAIGGGSVLDAGKAVAGMLPSGRSVLDHLEGVGPQLPYPGPALPLVAAPTTAGTGSEATKNAVLSRHGRDGFKKSFRDDKLVARVAVVDPDCLMGAPDALLAANGMDAFTQLLESYTSTRANPLTDALALAGMQAFRDGFFAVWEKTPEAAAGRSRLAYASLLSGICLAQTGLGVVHGLASPLGAHTTIPHGVVCGTLLAVATEVNIRALRQREPESPALDKYARIGAMLAHRHLSQADGLAHLVRTLHTWVERLGISPLVPAGFDPAEMDAVVAKSGGSSMKTNPLVLTDPEIREILERRLR